VSTKQMTTDLFSLVSLPLAISNRKEKIKPRSSPAHSSLPLVSKVRDRTRPTRLHVPPWIQETHLNSMLWQVSRHTV